MHSTKWLAFLFGAAFCISLLLAQPSTHAQTDAGEAPSTSAADSGETPVAESPAAGDKDGSEADKPDAELQKLIEENTWDQVNLDSGANAWMLVSCALVLMMTAPGLALFYSGLVRKKNVLGVMMQCLFLMGIMTVLWGLCGYSLCFGGDGVEQPWIGNGEFLFMSNVQLFPPERPSSMKAANLS